MVFLFIFALHALILICGVLFLVFVMWLAIDAYRLTERSHYWWALCR
jgi:hypothetical protein